MAVLARNLIEENWKKFFCMIKWISTTERLPKNGEWVFTCICDNGVPQSAGICRYDEAYHKWYNDEDEETIVDYWMPIPNFNAGKLIYLAAPVTAPREIVKTAALILRDAGFDVYVPIDHHVDHAWEYPNNEWGLMVFQSDIESIRRSDIVVVLSYGRESTAGTNWEAGYAFGIGKKVIVVEECASNGIMSLMVSNGRYATVEGLSGLESYDWSKMEKTRTKTEQK